MRHQFESSIERVYQSEVVVAALTFATLPVTREVHVHEHRSQQLSYTQVSQRKKEVQFMSDTYTEARVATARKYRCLDRDLVHSLRVTATKRLGTPL